MNQKSISVVKAGLDQIQSFSLYLKSPGWSA